MKITLEINMAGDIMMIPASKYSRAANNYSIKAGILVTLHPHTGPAYHYWEIIEVLVSIILW